MDMRSIRQALIAILCLVSPSVVLGQGAPFVPNDPYFYPGTPAGFVGQWHLDSQSSGAVVDVNVRGAWDRGWTGKGVTIGVIEGVLDWSHPDLVENYSPEHSWDFVQNASLEATTNVYGRTHATAVAGVAAARGGNGIGVTGAAPYAKLAGLAVSNKNALEVLYDAADDARWASALLYNNAADGTGINIKTHSWHPSNPLGFIPYPLAEQAVRDATSQGTIVVFHAGNWRTFHGIGSVIMPNVDWWDQPAFEANTTKGSVRRLPEVINVGALGTSGQFAEYSSFGSNMTVTVPVGNKWWELNDGITTTDNQGTARGYSGVYTAGENNTPNPIENADYAAGMTGTSFAAPLAAGVIALAKEAQPRLDTRFAKHLMARTSRVVDALDSTPMGGWTTNSAGINFNNNYGFGLLDADRLTAAATEYVGVTPLQERSSGLIAVNDYVPLDNGTGMSRAFQMTGTDRLEEVIVNLRINAGIDDPRYFERGDLEATITSPSGVTSLLMYQNFSDRDRKEGSGFIDWPFLSNAFWGEEIAGEWSVTVRDLDNLSDIIRTHWVDFEVEFRTGELVPAAPGDFDADGDVDGGDFLVWQRDAGPAVRSRADDNSDGVVDAADLAIWRESFGIEGSSSFASVPEPPSIGLLLAGMAVVLGVTQRRCVA